MAQQQQQLLSVESINRGQRAQERTMTASISLDRCTRRSTFASMVGNQAGSFPVMVCRVCATALSFRINPATFAQIHTKYPRAHHAHTCTIYIYDEDKVVSLVSRLIGSMRIM